jgi:hypothetical protein
MVTVDRGLVAALPNLDEAATATAIVVVVPL